MIKKVEFVALAGLISAMTAASAVAQAPAIPSGASPLVEADIMAMLDGHGFAFTAYDEPLVGTSFWNGRLGFVFGSYVLNGGEEGTYELEWFIKDGKNCTKAADKDPVCQTIFKYETGFMEVTSDGKVHAVSKPDNHVASEPAN